MCLKLIKVGCRNCSAQLKTSSLFQEDHMIAHMGLCQLREHLEDHISHIWVLVWTFKLIILPDKSVFHVQQG